jgi:hypothetical protein
MKKTEEDISERHWYGKGIHQFFNISHSQNPVPQHEKEGIGKEKADYGKRT